MQHEERLRRRPRSSGDLERRKERPTEILDEIAVSQTNAEAKNKAMKLKFLTI